MKRIGIFLLSALVIVFILPHFCSAQDEEPVTKVFVSALRGDNDDSGTTPSEPVATITKALEICADTPFTTPVYIYVETGDYLENITLPQGRHLLGGLNLLDSTTYLDDNNNFITEYTEKKWTTVSRIIADSSLPVIQGDDGEPLSLPARQWSNAILNFYMESGIIGVLCSPSFQPFLLRCQIFDSSLYGVAANGSSPSLVECRITSSGLACVYILEVETEEITFQANPFIANCIIRESSGSGINSISPSWAEEVIGTAIETNTEFGVYFEGSSPQFSDCTINDNKSGGIFGSGSTSVALSEIKNNVGGGINISGSTESVISDSVFTGNIGDAIVFTSSKNIQIDSCFINDNGGIGVSFDAVESGAILRSDFLDQDSYSIKISNASTVGCDDNQIVWSGKDGILVGLNSIVTASGNELYFSQGSGCYITNKSTMSFDSNNIFAGNLGEGVLIGGESQCLLLDDNYIYSNSLNGIKVTEKSKLTIEKSIVAINARNGIFCTTTMPVSIVNSVLYDNGLNGIYLEIASDVTIRDSIIARNRIYGVIERYPTYDPKTLSYNCFYNNDAGNYLDENAFVRNTQSEINTQIINPGGIVEANIVADPLFVAWGTFSEPNPIYVDKNHEGAQDGTQENPFRMIIRALGKYDFHLSESSPCIDKGTSLADIGAYPGALAYDPKGSNRVSIIVLYATEYNESSLVVPGGVSLVTTDTPIVGRGNLDVLLPQRDAYIRGFAIRKGNIGIICGDQSAATITNCTIENNQYSGITMYNSNSKITESSILNNEGVGIRIYGGAPRVENNAIKGNWEHGVSCHNASNAIIWWNTISNNFINGIDLYNGASPNINRNTIYQNYKNGIYMNQNCSPVVAYNTVERNSEIGIFFNDHCSPIIKGNRVVDNILSGINALYYCNGTIDSNTIKGNVFYGILCRERCNPLVRNNFICDNAYDGIRVIQNSNATIVNNTVYGNLFSGVYISTSAPIVRNNIILGNDIGIVELDSMSDPAAFTNNLFFQQVRFDYHDEGVNQYSFISDDLNAVVNNGAYAVANNIYGDPLIIDIEDGDYHLHDNSPCKNAGTLTNAPTVDIEEDARPADGGVDIGADEITTQKHYFFNSGTEGWSFDTVAPIFVAPEGEYKDGRLIISFEDDINFYGSWSSNPDAIPVYPDKLYRARFNVLSSVDKPACPTIRLRMNSQNLQQVNMLVIQSTGDGAASPPNNNRNGALYDLYFVPPQSAVGQPEQYDDLIFSFDVYNFEVSDARTGFISLESLVVDTKDLASLPPATNLFTYTFESTVEGWTEFIPGDFPFTVPTYAYTAGKLLMTAPDYQTYGYWFSPSDDLNIMAPGTLYIMQYLVDSDQTDASKVPGMQFRALTQDFQFSSIMGINSTLGGESSPIQGSPKIYSLYMMPHPSANGKGLQLTFDILNFDYSDAAPGTVSVDTVAVRSYPEPSF